MPMWNWLTQARTLLTAAPILNNLFVLSRTFVLPEYCPGSLGRVKNTGLLLRILNTPSSECPLQVENLPEI